MTWRWLHEQVVLAIHSEQIAQHGGDDGVRDAGLLSSALLRPQQQAHYAKVTVFDLAAAYAFGLIRNHPFVDGNKRTGFLAAYVFLALQDWTFDAPEIAVVEAVLSLAAGTMDENKFAAWLKVHAKQQESR